MESFGGYVYEGLLDIVIFDLYIICVFGVVCFFGLCFLWLLLWISVGECYMVVNGDLDFV